jgi:hypothetical protein
MAVNEDKVEEKAAKELEEKIEAGKSPAVIENELKRHNVAYKIKDKKRRMIYKPWCAIVIVGIRLQDKGCHCTCDICRSRRP